MSHKPSPVPCLLCYKRTTSHHLHRDSVSYNLNEGRWFPDRSACSSGILFSAYPIHSNYLVI